MLLKDQHEGYITWSEFERNQRVITNHATGKGSAVIGAVRRGELLLAGLLRCGHCGRKMYVGYGVKAGRYYCQGALVNHGTARCISFGSLRARPCENSWSEVSSGRGVCAADRSGPAVPAAMVVERRVRAVCTSNGGTALEATFSQSWLRLDRCNQRSGPHDVDDAREIVGEDVERHLSGHAW